MKKIFCGRPGEYLFRHPHFRKQEYYFFWCNDVKMLSKSLGFGIV